MKRTALPTLLCAMLLATPAWTAARVDPLCAPMRTFLTAIKPDTSRVITLHSTWGGGFRRPDGTSDKGAMWAMQCENHDFKPARTLCLALLKTSSREFPGSTVVRLLACISPRTRLPTSTMINSVDLDMQFGSDNRGANINIKLGEDPKLGGSVLTVTADAY